VLEPFGRGKHIVTPYVVWGGVQGPFHDTLQDNTHGHSMYQLHIMDIIMVHILFSMLPSWFTRPLANQEERWHSYMICHVCTIGGGCFSGISSFSSCTGVCPLLIIVGVTILLFPFAHDALVTTFTGLFHDESMPCS
jgi:hypothetical protein